MHAHDVDEPFLDDPVDGSTWVQLVLSPLVVGLLWLLVLYVTMVYGPIAAALVEMFPARIRYTSMSLPYHIGNGWFGGMLPLLATAMVAASGDIYFGLWYPIGVALMTVAVGALFLRDHGLRAREHEQDQ
jgi:hypothetical protein